MTNDRYLWAAIAGGVVLALLVIRTFVAARRTDGEGTGTERPNASHRWDTGLINLLLAAVGILFAFNELRLNQMQVDLSQSQVGISERAQFTNQYVLTIDQIGSDSIAAQLGGIHGLLAVAREAAAHGDESYYVILDETLSAFIRQQAPWPCSPTCRPDAAHQPSSVVQIALQVLGAKHVNRTTPRAINLQQTDLRGARLANLDLRGADMRGSNITRADVTGADLRGADLSGAISRDLRGRSLAVSDEQTKWA